MPKFILAIFLWISLGGPAQAIQDENNVENHAAVTHSPSVGSPSAERTSTALVQNAIAQVTGFNSLSHNHVSGASLTPAQAPCGENVSDGAWDLAIWEARNKKDSEIPLRNQLPQGTSIKPMNFEDESSLFVRHDDERMSYELVYNHSNQRLHFKVTFKGKNAIPPFKVQHFMLQELAKQTGKPIVVRSIMRDSIINMGANEALKSDFQLKGFENRVARTIEPEKIRGMKFFKSENGRNTLDVIKKLRPSEDPFLLIKGVSVENDPTYWLYQGPNVIIELTEPLRVDPPSD